MMNSRQLSMLRGLCVTICVCASTQVQAYPLDGYEATGIRRLQSAANGLVAGAKLPREAVQISGLAISPLPALDESLSAAIRKELGNEANNYGVAVLDFSDAQAPVFAGHQVDYAANVGSVGKILVLMAWFQQLADQYPDDLAARERVLRDSRVIADEFIDHDEHDVPIFDAASGRNVSRRLRVGDQGSLWEYLDWMLSASSNAAASMVMKELVIARQLGPDYAQANMLQQQAARNAVLQQLSTGARGKLLGQALLSPLPRHGLNSERIRQGSLFTRVGKQRIPGVTSSTATPRDLLQLLALIEAGRFVDEWSSREAKRLLYMTQKRIRYASHPVLNPAAVYFKSGSLYSCAPEPGFVCRKYMGNKLNRLASLALVEYPAEQPQLRYAVAVMSNVLRVNSAVAHQTLALRIHRLIEARHKAANTPLKSQTPAPDGAISVPQP